MSKTIHPRKAKAIRLGVYEAQKPGAVVASDMQRDAVTKVADKSKTEEKTSGVDNKVSKSKAKKKPEAPKTADKSKADDKPSKK